MLDQFYVASTGLTAFQAMMVNITNNISNAQTVWYKKSRLELESLFPKLLEESAAYYLDEENVSGLAGKKKNKQLEFGSGVKIVDVQKDFTAGTLEITNKPLDLAIQGEGLLQFRLNDGTIAYSRAGNLHQDTQGNIVHPNGYPLEPNIRVPENATNIIIDNEGRVFVQLNNEPVQKEIGQVFLAKFPNVSGLQSMGQNLYIETVDSGEAVSETPGRNSTGSIAQYSLEFSNVNIVEEMVQMVMTQRAFELSTKAVQAGESMLKNATDIARS